MNVFGESVLNDAVAMVLFQTFNGFAVHEVALSAGSIMRGKAMRPVASCKQHIQQIPMLCSLGLCASALNRNNLPARCWVLTLVPAL